MIYENNTTTNYYDLDAQGDVKLTAMLKHINLAAAKNAAEMGIGLADTLPLAFVLQRFGLRIYQWPVWNQPIRIRTWPAEIVKGTFQRNGEMYSENDEKMAEWISLWVLIDIEARKVRRPSALSVELPTYGRMGVTIEAHKVNAEEGELLSTYNHIVRFSETDTYQHMNNVVYADLIANVLYESQSPLARPQNWTEIQINYIAETRIGDEIEMQCRQAGKTINILGSVEGRDSFASSIITK